MNRDKWSRNRRNRYNWNKSRRNKYRWNRLLCSVSRWTRGRSLYYGLAIAASLLIISGLLSSLSSREEEKVKKQPDTSRQHAEEGQEPQLTENPNIRVLIMTTGHAGIVHPGVEVSSPAGLVLSFGEEQQEIEPGQKAAFAPDDERFAKGNLRIQAKDGGEVTLDSIERGYGVPSYAGTLELRTTAEGIVIINELPVETYLCKVVPSEMPASYELEARKAQAVCARCSAYQQMAEYGSPEYEAHVNDSTDYQVYGNSQAQEASSQAVSETQGQVARFNGQIVTTYYYSTSCGKTTSLEAWGTEANEQNQYLQTVEVKDEEGDYERELPWYRWEARIPVQTLSNLVGLNTATDVGTLQNVEVTRTGPGGVALQICATGDKGSVTVDTENKIRRALGGSGYEIQKQDGNTVASSALLPSAFFTIGKEGDTFVIKGGGYGHGIGMSQNGANEMAKKGKTYIDILTLFFPGITVE